MSLGFIDRERLVSLFDEWRYEKSDEHIILSACSASFICFLQSKGLLDEEKVKKFLFKDSFNKDI